jgi:hypothetical protein
MKKRRRRRKGRELFRKKKKERCLLFFSFSYIFFSSLQKAPTMGADLYLADDALLPAAAPAVLMGDRGMMRAAAAAAAV